jgi:hypothetical protein
MKLILFSLILILFTFVSPAFGKDNSSIERTPTSNVQPNDNFPDSLSVIISSKIKLYSTFKYRCDQNAIRVLDSLFFKDVNNILSQRNESYSSFENFVIDYGIEMNKQGISWNYNKSLVKSDTFGFCPLEDTFFRSRDTLNSNSKASTTILEFTRLYSALDWLYSNSDKSKNLSDSLVLDILKFIVTAKNINVDEKTAWIYIEKTLRFYFGTGIQISINDATLFKNTYVAPFVRSSNNKKSPYKKYLKNLQGPEVIDEGQISEIDALPKLYFTNRRFFVNYSCIKPTQKTDKLNIVLSDKPTSSIKLISGQTKVIHNLRVDSLANAGYFTAFNDTLVIRPAGFDKSFFDSTIDILLDKYKVIIIDLRFNPKQTLKLLSCLEPANGKLLSRYYYFKPYGMLYKKDIELSSFLKTSKKGRKFKNHSFLVYVDNTSGNITEFCALGFLIQPNTKLIGYNTGSFLGNRIKAQFAHDKSISFLNVGYLYSNAKPYEGLGLFLSE